jgi:hypothetical protein
MQLPFTPEQFFAVFAAYNVAVWPAQWALNALALGCVVALMLRAKQSGRVVALILAMLWLWMAIAYHFAFFTRINPAAWAFGAMFLFASATFAWFGALRNELTFQSFGNARSVMGVVLIVFALVIYPAIGYAAGHRYPSTPTFGLPCPTTIFTFGVLLCSNRPPSWWVLAVPLVWSSIGSIAAWQLDVPQDLTLLGAGVSVLALRWRKSTH